MSEFLPEQFDLPHGHELYIPEPYDMVGLLRQKMKVQMNRLPLIPKAIALAQGVPGDVVLAVMLPFDQSAGFSKAVGLINYGPHVSPDNPVPYLVLNGTLRPDLGEATTQYGLRPLNYQPYGLIGDHVAIASGDSVVLGGNAPTRASIQLGLFGPDKGNEHIDEQHATLSLSEDVSHEGVFTVEDHSTHGTRVITGVSPPQSLAP